MVGYSTADDFPGALLQYSQSLVVIERVFSTTFNCSLWLPMLATVTLKSRLLFNIKESPGQFLTAGLMALRDRKRHESL